jgi:hypothetical protein
MKTLSDLVAVTELLLRLKLLPTTRLSLGVESIEEW